MTTDTSNSGIYVVEGPERGQDIPVSADSVTAFVGPAPRGPIDHAVPVSSPEEFQKIFGAPECHCRLEYSVRQFFANGGTKAVIVRVSGTSVRNRIHLSAGDEGLTLEARNPGPLEHLRASIDFDGIDEESNLFNLTVQRLRSAGSAWIDAQEYYRALSVDVGSRDYVGYILSQSDLVTLYGETPSVRPDATYKALTAKQSGYVDTLAECVNSPPPSDYDLVGSAAKGTGLSALEHFPDIGQLVLLSGAEGAPLGPVVLLAADQFCRNHQCLLIIDPPSRWKTVKDVLRDQERSGFASPNAVTWFPGVCTRNQQGEKVWTSAAGSIAAALIKTYKPEDIVQLHSEDPVFLRDGMRLSAKPVESDVNRLARLGINTLVQSSALHLQLHGNVTQARYGSISADWNSLLLRQQVLFVLRRIRAGTRWTLFNDSNPDTWNEITAQVGDFLSKLRECGMLPGENTREAYFVKCDSDTNDGLSGRLGEVTFIVGFAVRRPGEFLAFRFQRCRNGCRIHELGWQSHLEELAV
ncbi:MAG: hypothetical protein ACR2QG_09670 [Gammaproteobacteria bacterium]